MRKHVLRRGGQVRLVPPHRQPNIPNKKGPGACTDLRLRKLGALAAVFVTALGGFLSGF